MLKLRWIRTILCALAFAWAMIAWHLHEHYENLDRLRMLRLIDRMCGDRTDQKAKDLCEFQMRVAGIGSGNVRVTGSVDVSGNVDMN